MAWLGPVIGAAGSIFGGLFGANASEEASQQYIEALQNAQNELTSNQGFGLSYLQPYSQAGQRATTTLSSLLGTPGKGLLAPWTGQFTAPTAAQAAKTPGYQFQVQQGENAMQNSAAGQGGLLSGRTLASLNNYAQGVASTNYQNTFNNALTQYQQGYQSFLNNQNNTYQRLLGMSGLGLNASQGAAGLIANTGQDIASLYGQEGAARAQGTMGAANAYSGMFGGLGNAANSYTLLSMLNGSSPFASPDSTLSVPGGSTGYGGINPYGIPGTGLPGTANAMDMSGMPQYALPQ